MIEKLLARQLKGTPYQAEFLSHYNRLIQELSKDTTPWLKTYWKGATAVVALQVYWAVVLQHNTISKLEHKFWACAHKLKLRKEAICLPLETPLASRISAMAYLAQG
jgi:hypothetical protein